MFYPFYIIVHQFTHLLPILSLLLNSSFLLGYSPNASFNALTPHLLLMYIDSSCSTLPQSDIFASSPSFFYCMT
uniref:Uncharacterized protein n=1 Tax=Caenorhabditis japonica TaxID=281687 RepID=A0A8R1EDQ7_CAEJA